MNTNKWIPVTSIKPIENRLVETKIDDRNGCRNVATLKYGKNMWWHPDMSMYVYYTPTHWRELSH
jgi:hypothetical protein